MSASGFAYPILPNAGIGTEVPLTIHPLEWSKERTSDVQSLLALKLQADLHLSKLRKIFQELESATVPDVQLDPAELANPSLDVVLQLLASGSRGGNLKAQAWLISELNTTLFDSEVLQPLQNKIKQKDGKEDVQSIFSGLKKSDLDWFVQSEKDSGNANSISQVVDLVFGS